MEKSSLLKIGDIRKFNLNKGSIVGVVIKEPVNSYYRICNIMGKCVDIPINTAVSSVRLDTNLRSAFENIAQEYKKRDKLAKELEIQNERVDNVTKKLRKLTGYLENNEFRTVVLNNISKIVKERATALGYDIDVSVTNENIVAYLSKCVYIQKYIQSQSYDFINVEYDGSFYIDNEYSKDYDRVLKKYATNLLNLKNVQDSQKGINFNMFTSLNIGDKNTLYFSHEISVCIKNTGLTLENAKFLASCIRLR